MADQPPTLKERIDADEGLKSKRNALTWVSLVLLGVTFTGAVVQEANTFILKISFKQGEALGILLFLVIIFLLIRYISYAQTYHLDLENKWKEDFLSDKRIRTYCHYSDEIGGLYAEIAPKEYLQELDASGHPEAGFEWVSSYHSRFWFFKYFIFCKNDMEYGEPIKTVNVSVFKELGLLRYLKFLFWEFRHRLAGYYKYPENLDVQAPYFIALASVASLFFQEELSTILNWISS